MSSYLSSWFLVEETETPKKESDEVKEIPKDDLILVDHPDADGEFVVVEKPGLDGFEEVERDPRESLESARKEQSSVVHAAAAVAVAEKPAASAGPAVKKDTSMKLFDQKNQERARTREEHLAQLATAMWGNDSAATKKPAYKKAAKHR